MSFRGFAPFVRFSTGSCRIGERVANFRACPYPPAMGAEARVTFCRICEAYCGLVAEVEEATKNSPAVDPFAVTEQMLERIESM